MSRTRCSVLHAALHRRAGTPSQPNIFQLRTARALLIRGAPSDYLSLPLRRRIAGDLSASPAQVAIVWVAAQGNDIVPLVGSRRRDRLSEALGALDMKLTDAHLAELAKAFPPGAAAGARYPEAQLAHMDSERPAKAS